MDHLENFSDSQLEDIIENYKLYKYDESVKRQAVEILAKRNVAKRLDPNEKADARNEKIKTEANKRRGNLLTKFIWYSIFSSITYLLLFLGSYAVDSYSHLANFGILFLLFILFYSLTFITQRRYYDYIRHSQRKVPGWLFLFVGILLVPFFLIIVYNRMNQYRDIYFSG